ncbi:hypothetical protein I309_04296 [Cryptococcus deuterogattii LA55]|nr:hypothetical protein I309_04296 [Cryptococcus deuterogattii LA55]KIR95970.1 hypothetical protein I304_00735 [Cryptococcus deuterogattii CBS 10090]
MPISEEWYSLTLWPTTSRTLRIHLRMKSRLISDSKPRLFVSRSKSGEKWTIVKKWKPTIGVELMLIRPSPLHFPNDRSKLLQRKSYDCWMN